MDKTTPAFPQPTSVSSSGDAYYPVDPGMSLRDWFAGQAMQGWLASYSGSSPPPAGMYLNEVVVFSYKMADAMMEARDA